MLDIQEIQKYFPPQLRGNPQYHEYMVKELIHYRMLDAIFNSKWSEKLSFIGGTNLRIIHKINRFSEDLDFDCFHLSKEEFSDLTGIVVARLHAEGFAVKAEDRSTDSKLNAFRRIISFPGLLFDLKLTGHKEKKCHIKIEAEPHYFKYTPDKIIIQKFNIMTQISTTPVDILLSMKIAAMLDRLKGRDFYDVMYLRGKTMPNIEYLKEKLQIGSVEDLKKRILEVCNTVDFQMKSLDFKNLVYPAEEIEKVKLFPEYIRQNL